MNCVKPPGCDASNTSKACVAPGCGGGDPWMIFEHMEREHVPDETCQPYEAKNGVCDAPGVCRNCAPDALLGSGLFPPGGPCWAVEAHVGYGVREYGGVRGEVEMQKEIWARGPITCSLAADDAFMRDYSRSAAAHEGVYVDPTYLQTPSAHTSAEIDHDVEVAGWGTTPSGLPYWIIRNSWGTYWGEGGWFKLLRGSNHLFIEEDCQWATPTFDELEEALDGAVSFGDYVHGSPRLPVGEQLLSHRPTTSAPNPVASLNLGAARAPFAPASYAPRDSVRVTSGILAVAAGADAGSSSWSRSSSLVAVGALGLAALALVGVARHRRERIQREGSLIEPLSSAGEYVEYDRS